MDPLRAFRADDDEGTNVGTMDETHEVVVVGGGPGGSTVAAHLARAGRDVVVLERARFPRFHIGESLLPASAPILADLGVLDALDATFVRKYGARFLDDATGDEAQYRFAEAFPPSTPYAWQVTRAELDELLSKNASRLGADVRHGWKVVSPIRDAAGAVVGVLAKDEGGTERRLHARVVVDASGREGLLTRGAASRDRARIPGLDKTAIFTAVQGGHRNEGIDAGQIELPILDLRPGEGHGWAWFIPFRSGVSSVGFVLPSEVARARLRDAIPTASPEELPSDPHEYERPDEVTARLRAVFEGEVARSPWMKRLVGEAPIIAPVRAAADYSFRVASLAGDGWLAVGDAAGFLDPLFSTGAHLAFGGGVRAARTIDAALTTGDVSAARFADYATSLRAAADLFLGAVQSFYRGELRALLFARDQRHTLRRIITSMLAGDVFHDESVAASRWVGFFRQRFSATV